MAAIKNLTAGTRIRLKRNYVTSLGNQHEAGKMGTVPDPPIFFKDPMTGIVHAWVWWDTKRGHSGAWCPIQMIVRLRRQRGPAQSR